MNFNIYLELSYDVQSPTTFIFNIQAAKSASQKIMEEKITFSPALSFEEFTLYNNDARFIKLFVNERMHFNVKYKATVAVDCKKIDTAILLQPTSIFELDKDVIPYLFPSRHCQSDKIRKLAIKQFGKLETNYDKVIAINNWINQSIDYITGTTDSGTSAYDTLIQREGVCKDYANLGIALCRALDIPARYFTGYAYNLFPADIHACFEAYIGGHWIIFDPTKLAPLNGLIKIAHGKDATEVPVASFFGNTNCIYMNVQCNLINEDVKNFYVHDDSIHDISYE